MHQAFRANKRDNAISQFGQKPKETHSQSTPEMEIGPHLYFTVPVAQCGLAINCTSTSLKQCFTVKMPVVLLSLYIYLYLPHSSPNLSTYQSIHLSLDLYLNYSDTSSIYTSRVHAAPGRLYPSIVSYVSCKSSAMHNVRN